MKGVAFARKWRETFRAAALAAGLTAALLTTQGGGCGGGGKGGDVRVQTDYDHAVDFSRFHTFGFGESHLVQKNGAPDDGNTIVMRRLQSAIAAQLTAKGLRPATDGEAPDLLVAFTGRASQSSKSVPTVQPGVGVDVGSVWGGSGVGVSVGMGSGWRTVSVNEASLTVDLTGPDRQLVWRGVASRKGGSAEAPDEDAANRLMARLFDGFPPKGRR